MQLILLLTFACFTYSYGFTPQKHSINFKNSAYTITLSDSLKMNSQIKKLDSDFKIMERELYDSVRAYHADNVDFSSIAGGLEKKYAECKDNLTKAFIGYKLAQDYFLHFNSSKKIEYRQKAEPLFYSFLCLNDGDVASSYLKLDIRKLRFITNEWTKFSEQDQTAILFYGLLRGFNHGLPDILYQANRLTGVWGHSVKENASFQIQTDSIYYPEYFKSYKYQTKKDSIYIHYDGWIYKGAFLFRNDSLILKTQEKESRFVRIRDSYSSK